VEKDVIMRIDPAGKPVPNAAPLRTRRAQPGFVLPGEAHDAAAEAEAPEAAAPAFGIAPITGAPSDPPAAVADDAPAAEHGEAMLKAMSGVQLALLEGTGDAACRTLATLAESLPSAADPGLQAVLQSVAVRAAVVLARAE
jgi:hypothetical protein